MAKVLTLEELDVRHQKLHGALVPMHSPLQLSFGQTGYHYIIAKKISSMTIETTYSLGFVFKFMV